MTIFLKHNAIPKGYKNQFRKFPFRVPTTWVKTSCCDCSSYLEGNRNWTVELKKKKNTFSIQGSSKEQFPLLPSFRSFPLSSPSTLSFCLSCWECQRDLWGLACPVHFPSKPAIHYRIHQMSSRHTGLKLGHLHASDYVCLQSAANMFSQIHMISHLFFMCSHISETLFPMVPLITTHSPSTINIHSWVNCIYLP